MFSSMSRSLPFLPVGLAECVDFAALHRSDARSGLARSGDEALRHEFSSFSEARTARVSGGQESRVLTTMTRPTLEDVRRAAERIKGLVHRTPVMSSRLFNAAAGAECFFKCENLQRSGAFKMRGAANFLLSLT